MSQAGAVVWAATWVPRPSPVEGFGADGYSVCWADRDRGGRVQVLVEGSRPEPGARGRIVTRAFGDERVELFIEERA